ncbi:MAG TPA: SAM-dependent chlorinase/fluorinase [Anaerolineales bacterium]|nr:SAM-dependent chlorinase/fluorinase [Anaerolineales bacterium]
MKPILVFQTDFTYKESSVSAMYGVVKSVDRELEIMDGTHEIPQYDIWSASFRLIQHMQFWPSGTIFVSVVDPGVGTSRKACVAKTADGYYVVTPDNGALTHVKHSMGIIQVREIDEKVNRLLGKGTDDTNVFHGRDLFGYCAAKLASGLITYEQVGPEYPVDEIIALPIYQPKIENDVVKGILEINDPNFGNMWTNIPLSLFTDAGFAYGDFLHVKIQHAGQVVFDQKILFHKSFGFAEKGDAIIYNNELMKVSLAVSQGSFSDKHDVGFGPEWEVEFTR